MKNISHYLISNLHTEGKREFNQNRLGQKAKVVWMTGLSGSGKTTITNGMDIFLKEKGFITQIFDGDNLRSGINSDLGFSISDRTENIRRAAEIAKLFIDCGIIVIACFVSPTEKIRNLAKDIIGTDDFIEVFVHCPIEICENRDVKGLYKKARLGIIKEFTGITSPYEEPITPQITLPTHQLTIQETIDTLLAFILPKITLST